jgi:2-dehydro-3-deoxyphosphogluconate aldolase/(4S)-4-hydroxy-2-oxoglutarate aldolase
MTIEEIGKRIRELGVVPVVAIDDVRGALSLADALIEGGLPVAEITFRTAAAEHVIKTLSSARPQLLVGAGTVLTSAQMMAAQAAGASFAFAPGFNATIVSRARKLGLPFVPGVATPSEIEEALAQGCTFLKFFPAGDFGGVKMLTSLAGPYEHTGVRIVPTGGVDLTNLEAYLACKIVAAVGGSWLARKEDLAAGHWQVIRRRCEEAAAIVRMVRARVR